MCLYVLQYVFAQHTSERSGRTIHEELAKNLTLTLRPANTDNTVIVKFLQHSWFFFEILVKSMAQYLITTGKIKVIKRFSNSGIVFSHFRRNGAWNLKFRTSWIMKCKIRFITLMIFSGISWLELSIFQKPPGILKYFFQKVFRENISEASHYKCFSSEHLYRIAIMSFFFDPLTYLCKKRIFKGRNWYETEKECFKKIFCAVEDNGFSLKRPVRI